MGASLLSVSSCSTTSVCLIFAVPFPNLNPNVLLSMASCGAGDNFPIYGDDDHHQASNNLSSHPHHHHHNSNQPYAAATTAQRFNSKAITIHAPPRSIISPPVASTSAKQIVAGDDGGSFEDYSEAAFPHVNPFSAEDGSSPLGRGIVDGRSEKRKDREELSDGGTPYSYTKKSKQSGGGDGTSCEYRKDREEWSDAAIACLLDAYIDKFTQLNRGNLRGRDWEEVAVTVTERCDNQAKSVEQCKNKVDNLKKRYKLERHRMSSGGISVSHWPWFKKMEEIVGYSLPIKVISDEDKAAGASSNVPRASKRYALATPSPTSQITNLKSKPVSNPKWRRVVFKISGAALAGIGPNNIAPKVVMLIAKEVAIACRLGVEVAIVVGGRNFFCGDSWVTATDSDRSTAYQIGMMATVMNSILLHSALEKMGVQTRVQTAFAMQEVAESYSRQRAIRHLEKGRVVIFGGIGAGTGNPLFSTDTAAALRASEIQAEAVLKGTNVDGVYDCNSSNNNATFEHISFRDLVSRGATSMDMMAMTFCEKNEIPVVVFNLLEPGNISRALCGEQVGTLIDQTGGIS